MEENLTETVFQSDINFALLSYNDSGQNIGRKLVSASGLDRNFRVVNGHLSNHKEITCDAVLAVYTADDDINTFASDIASLRFVKNIQILYVVVAEDARSEVVAHENDISTHHIIYLPVSPSDFQKAVMTNVVEFKLKTGGSRKRSANFRRNPNLLGEILVEHGIIAPMQLKKALDRQRGSDDKELGDILVKLGFITEEQKVHFIAGQLGVELVTPKKYADADVNVVALIPEHVAKANTCIALEKQGEVLTVAMVDVLNLQLLDNLRDITEMTINPILGIRENIEKSIERFYRDISSQKDASELAGDVAGDLEYVEQKAEDVDIEEAVAQGAELGIIKLVNMVIANAIRDRSSDIHIEPMEHILNIRYRVDGELRQVMSPPKQSHQAIITRIKILSKLDIAERRLPQDGRMVVKIGHREVDIRVSILPTVHGEKGVLRILDKEAFEKSVANLGFSKENEMDFRAQVIKPYGMIIVTGPTGSGKSTTLYSALQLIKDVKKNIITVEDPVEFHMKNVTQVNVNTKIELTFGAALRSILRQDPDIILIGEIRDQETADIAIKMALTGHLVFSTLHTNDAASTISRFVDIGIPPLLLGSSLNLIIAQRLVRRVCTKCKVEYTPAPEMLEQLSLTETSGVKFYKGEGCVSCNSNGYSGRTGLFEIMTISHAIRKLILRNASTMEIQAQAVKDGMQTLRAAGIEKVLAGETTVEQVIAVSTET
jgi:type IV pilus assembly protein PilB